MRLYQMTARIDKIHFDHKKLNCPIKQPSCQPGSRNWMQLHDITLWGAADLRDFSTPLDETGVPFPCALSWAIPMDPEIMASIQPGPNQPYADE